MARQRKGTVTESVYLLRQQEERCKGEPAEIRVRVLRLVKEFPSHTMAQIAELAGCSERSAIRWWKEYCDGGLEAVIAAKQPKGSALVRVGEERIQELGRKLQHRELASLSEIQRWLKDECNVEYSLPGVWHLVRRTFKVERSWTAGFGGEWGGELAPFGDVGATSVVPTNVVRFLNSLPLLGSIRDRIVMFREALQQLFPDVDRVVVNVNFGFNFEDPEGYRPDVAIRQTTSSDNNGSQTIMVVGQDYGGGTAEQLIETMRVQGYPLADYHAPSYMDFRLTDDAYLGTIFFFRVMRKAPISAMTLNTIASLESFFYFMLFDLAAQHQVTTPVDKAFTSALKQLAVEASLTIQERKVVIHQMLGCSYKEIAELLDISVTTLKKHITTIHQKTGTRSQGELFAKYFSPRLGPVLTSINEGV